MGAEARSVFEGQFVSHADWLGVSKARSACVKNSGANAIALAAWHGAKRIILLGYDCQRTGGMAHWHGDHPPSLGNAKSLPSWPEKFRQLIPLLSGTEVINCSRESALDCFPRGNLEDYL